MMANRGVFQPQTQADVRKDSESPLRICFVCTGNTCRSPMAEAIANFMVEKALFECLPKEFWEQSSASVVAFSAGLYAQNGDPISNGALEALKQAGIQAANGRDYKAHTAHTLGEKEAETYDLLIGMTSGHTMELILRFPHLADRILRFPKEISDPYGGDLARYSACLEQMKDGMTELLCTRIFDTKGEEREHGDGRV